MLEPYVPGSMYHVYGHANGNENLFIRPGNYPYFLLKYKQYMASYWKTYAYCLMPNHFHFMIEVKDGIENDEEVDINKLISKQWSNFLNSYAKAFNKVEERKGSLFRQNTKRKILDQDNYYINLLIYIHNNPARHGFTEHPADWPYSSYNSYLSGEQTSLPRDEVLNWFGGGSCIYCRS